MKRRTLLVAAVLLAATAAQAAHIQRVVPLVRDGHVYVTLELADAWTDDLRQAIQSGLRTSFTFEVELRRGVAAWVDRTLDTTAVSLSVQFDNLTRRYELTRTIDGRVTETRTTESEADVRRWLTSVDRLPVFRTAGLEPDAEYYVRVRARARPRNAMLPWPWDAAWAHARFTFIRR